jgi:hypothetical protein
MLPEPKRQLNELDETIIEIVGSSTQIIRLFNAIQLSEYMPPELRSAAHLAIKGMDPLFGACADHLKKVNQQ